MLPTFRDYPKGSMVFISMNLEIAVRLMELLPAVLIAGVPALLVLAQPDLGSALVFAGILFAMLFWAGTPPTLLRLSARGAAVM